MKTALIRAFQILVAEVAETVKELGRLILQDINQKLPLQGNSQHLERKFNFMCSMAGVYRSYLDEAVLDLHTE